MCPFFGHLKRDLVTVVSPYYVDPFLAIFLIVNGEDRDVVIQERLIFHGHSYTGQRISGLVFYAAL